MARRTRDETLQAYHDGELTVLGRWRVRWGLVRRPTEREALREFGLVGDLVRESEEAAEAPELWSGLSARLGAIDADVETRHSPLGGDLWGRSFWRTYPLRLGLAAAVVVALLFVFGPQLGRGPGTTQVVRSLVTEGKPVMVLPAEDDMTIIWVIESPTLDEVSTRGGRVLI